MQRRFTEDLLGLRVVGAAARTIGEVTDLVIDDTTLTLTGLVIAAEARAVEDLGLSRPFWGKARFVVPVACINRITDYVLLKVTLEEIGILVSSAVPE